MGIMAAARTPRRSSARIRLAGWVIAAAALSAVVACELAAAYELTAARVFCASASASSRFPQRLAMRASDRTPLENSPVVMELEQTALAAAE
ncbi:unnamed protein product, partial [Polarella glacialis]